MSLRDWWLICIDCHAEVELGADKINGFANTDLDGLSVFVREHHRHRLTIDDEESEDRAWRFQKEVP